MNQSQTGMVIHISGGNNQLLKDDSKAIQRINIYQTGKESVSPIREQPVAENVTTTTYPDLSSRFAIYVNKEEVRDRYIALLRACRSAAEVGRTVVALVQETPGLTIDTAKTEPFITILLNLSTSVSKGLTVPNFRKAIDNAWYTKKD